MTDDLVYASIAELAPRLAAKELSPVELTEAALARIEQLEPKLNAFIAVTAESARHAARAAEAESWAAIIWGRCTASRSGSRTFTRRRVWPPPTARRSMPTGSRISMPPRSSA